MVIFRKKHLQESFRGQNSETKAGKKSKSTENRFRKREPGKAENRAFSGSFYRVFLHDIPEMCIFIQEKQAV